MVSALHSSRTGGTRNFCNNGQCFGWNSIVNVWLRDLERTKKGGLTRLPGMQERYIQWDSWTRLNVKPSKIMQVSVYYFCVELDISYYIRGGGI